MRLQLALDTLSREEAKRLVQLLYQEVDIVEVGTPLLLRCGLKVVEEIKEIVGAKPVFADAKIVDAGRYETEMLLQSGANMVSVLAGASFSTLKEAKEICVKKQAELVVDTIDLPDPSPKRIEELRIISPDYVALHLASDLVQAGRSWEEVMPSSPFLQESFAFMVAGGLRPESLPRVLTLLEPQIVVVGSAVTTSSNPQEEVKRLKEVLHELA
ncbi:MAG: orotidine 5'-phosphate decarboxylase / HUMPS family protein [Atribacterota bacterium]